MVELENIKQEFEIDLNNIQYVGGLTVETDPTVPQHVKNITKADIDKWNSGTGGTSTEGTTNYTDLENKPKINNVELTGNKTLDELGIQAKGDYATATDLSTNYYKKTEISLLLAAKVNTSDLLSNYYKKTDIDNMIGDIETLLGGI